MRYHKNKPFITISEGNFTIYGYHEGEDESDALNYLRVNISDIAPKLTKEEKYQASVNVIRQNPLAYRVAGWILTHNSRFHVSTPPKSLESTQELLDSHHVDYKIGDTLTVSTDATQGRSFSVVTDNHRYGSQLEFETKVKSTFYQNNSDKVSMQAREFVLDFLLDELRFKLGNTQDKSAIFARIPEKFRGEFQAGMNMPEID